MGLFGLVGYGLLSMFFPSLMGGGASFVYSIVRHYRVRGTHPRLRYPEDQGDEHSPGNEEPTPDARPAIFGALMLYLDFINLFLSLLRITGRRQ